MLPELPITPDYTYIYICIYRRERCAEPPTEVLKLGAKLLLLISVQVSENLVHGGVKGTLPCLFIFFYLVECLL